MQTRDYIWSDEIINDRQLVLGQLGVLTHTVRINFMDYFDPVFGSFRAFFELPHRICVKFVNLRILNALNYPKLLRKITKTVLLEFNLNLKVLRVHRLLHILFDD